MTDEARRKILEAVAAGMMDPGEAADRLADLDAPSDARQEQHEEIREEIIEQRSIAIDERPRSQTTVRLVRVEANFRPVEIVGDGGVNDAVAEGTHRIRWEGDTLVIDGATGFDDDDFDDDDDERTPFGEWFRVGGPMIRRGMRVNYGPGSAYKPKPLRVRMNPEAGLEARVEAGPVKIVNVHGPIKARVTAGPLKIRGFESPIDVRVAAGKVDASGRLDHGESTIDCDAGKVQLHLTHGSHARVNASATLGKVDFGGREHAHRRDYFQEFKAHDLSDFGALGGLGGLGGFGDRLGERVASMLNNAFSDEHEVVVGDGTATVNIRVSMGAADITFDDQPSS